MSDLTPRQQQILEFIRDHVQENGMPPTRAEIARALGFKSASSLFWPIPQGYLDVRIAAAVIALINSIGNLGGFVAPTVFGYLEKTTGSVQYGLYGLAAASVLAAGLVFLVRTKPKA